MVNSEFSCNGSFYNVIFYGWSYGRRINVRLCFCDYCRFISYFKIMGINWILVGDNYFIKEDVKLEIKMSNLLVFDIGGNWELRIYKDKSLFFKVMKE